MSAIGRNSFKGWSGNGRKLSRSQKTASAVVLRIDDHREGGDFTPGGAIERVRQQEPPITLSLLAAINSDPAEKRRRDQRIERTKS